MRCLLLAALLLAGSARAQESWSARRMDLELSFLPEEGLLLVEGELVLANVSEQPRTRLELDLREAFAAEFQVHGGHATRVAAPPGSDSEPRFAVELDTAVPPGDECLLGISYAGAYTANQFAVTPRFAYGSWVSGWYPDVLRDDGERSERTPAVAGRTRLRLPEAWHGVTNGELVERTVEGGEALETWSVERPVARSFSAGPYAFEEHEVGARRVGVYQLSRTRSTPGESAATLAAALAAMEERFGPYPYPSFRIAEVPMELGNWGASSEQGFLLVKPNFLQSPGGNLALFAHEAAHGWWGNLVGQRGPGSILCSESMAQYGAVLAIEAIEGRAAATDFLRFSRPDYIPDQCARGYFQAIARGQDMPLAELEGGGWQHTLADAKGHWVWHMLRRRLGDELFFATLRDVLARYAERRMSLDELRAAFLAGAPPEADLERFFAQWLDRTGAPRLELEWSREGEHTTVVLRQVQAGAPFALRVPLDLVSADGSRRRVELRTDSAEARAAFEGPPPAEVLLDPEHELLAWTPEYE